MKKITAVFFSVLMAIAGFLPAAFALQRIEDDNLSVTTKLPPQYVGYKIHTGTITAGTAYKYYKVSAVVTGLGETLASTVLTVPLYDGSMSSENALRIIWAPVDGAVSYKLYKSVDNTSFYLLASSTLLTYVDEGIGLGAAYSAPSPRGGSITTENDITAGRDITATRNMFVTGNLTVSGSVSPYTIGTLTSDDAVITYGVRAATGVFTGAVEAATLDTGQGANELYDMDQNMLQASAVAFATVNTGQGAYELYKMDQNVDTAATPTFATVNTGNGANELYAMNQAVQTTNAVTFRDIAATYGVTAVTGTFSGAAAATTLNTGQGANELYAMNQAVQTTDAVTFRDVAVTYGVTAVTGTFSGAAAATTLDTGQGAYELYKMNQDVDTTGAPTFATVNTGQGAYELYKMDQNADTAGVVTFASVNTGLGDYELYKMNQNVDTAATPTFGSVNTGQGANELYAMNQAVQTTDGVTFRDVAATYGVTAVTGTFSGAAAATTLNTGQGANELYAMNQAVQTTDAVTFRDIAATYGVTAVTGTFSGAAAATTLNTGQGANELYAMNQAVQTTDAVTFRDIAATYGVTAVTGTFSGAAAATTLNTGQGANELYAMNQAVQTTDDVTHKSVTATYGVNGGSLTLTNLASSSGKVDFKYDEGTDAADGTHYFSFVTSATVGPTSAASDEISNIYARYHWYTGDNSNAVINGVLGECSSHGLDESITCNGGQFLSYAVPGASIRSYKGIVASARSSYLGGTDNVADSGTAFLGADIWLAPYFTNTSTANITSANFAGIRIWNEHASIPVANGIILGSGGGGFLEDIHLQNDETIDNATNGTVLITSPLVKTSGAWVLTNKTLSELMAITPAGEGESYWCTTGCTPHEMAVSTGAVLGGFGTAGGLQLD